MSTLPEDITSDIRARFHETHHNALELDMDSKGRPGFWNFDRSHFIPCAESFEAFRAEMRNLAPHCAEDAQGLGLLSD